MNYEFVLFSENFESGTRQRSIERTIITNWSLFKSPNGHVMNLLLMSRHDVQFALAYINVSALAIGFPCKSEQTHRSRYDGYVA
jgi:hypothetical protein